ncbi:MAG TPA: hypothetical protein VMQ51_13110 [Candidatus Binatia bacterium]|nr:hypothetical protein [Candidatus Binatia bacterium]
MILAIASLGGSNAMKEMLLALQAKFEALARTFADEEKRMSVDKKEIESIPPVGRARDNLPGTEHEPRHHGTAPVPNRLILCAMVLASNMRYTGRAVSRRRVGRRSPPGAGRLVAHATLGTHSTTQGRAL